MPAEPTLFTLPQSASTTADVVAFRYASYDVPFWARANTLPGRWHRVGDGPTQYWALNPDGAWAELIRHEDLTTAQDLRMVQMPMWTCRTPLAMVVDLCDPDTQERHGISAEQLISSNWTACQDLGRTLRQTYRGVLSPSAVLPGHVNFTMFGARRMISWDSRSSLASAVPAALVAIGRPPDDLLHRVHRPGRPAGRLFDA